MLEVTEDEFCDTMVVSAYSLISICQSLIETDVLSNGASIVSLSYIAAARSAFHPYKNISIAKAALERITKELGRNYQMRVHAIRFSHLTLVARREVPRQQRIISILQMKKVLWEILSQWIWRQKSSISSNLTQKLRERLDTLVVAIIYSVRDR